ncbi:MAG: undecaprenyl-diphosphate phosphatase [Bdellovibrionales bacterium]|nr:undecaprenyl-diphosphate phosphatase [Bdellovibrionales bacterium]
MWSIIILAIVQGLTEFFPVSSSGHLSLLEKYFEFNKSEALSIGLVLHLGTVFSVLVFYQNIFFLFLKNISKYKNFILYIVIACIPTGIIGILLKNTVKNMIFNLSLISVFFFITAAVLLISHWICKNNTTDKNNNFSLKNNPDLLMSSLNCLTVKKAFFIGCAQGLSVFPGLSRSGLTIASGRLLGLPPVVAGFFSFALMIPVVLGAFLLEAKSINFSASYVSISAIKISIGFLLSFFTGLVVLKLLQYILIQDKFYYFSYYLFLLIACIYFI